MKLKLVLMTAAVLLALPVLAADISVDGDCSLADAIAAANGDRAVGGCAAGEGADTITIAESATDGGTLRLDAALPEISSAMTIEGGGFTISGDEQHRVFRVISGGRLGIHALTVSGGKASNNESGGGIFVMDGGALHISDSTISHNSADFGGGGIYIGSGGSAVITKTTFSENEAVERYGGALWVDGSAEISDSTFSDNYAMNAGGAIDVGDGGSAVITNSTFSGNHSEDGGALGIYKGVAIIVNSTIIGNTADREGGGLYVWEGSEVFLHNSIIAASGESGDCVLEESADEDAPSLIAENTATLIEDGTCGAAFSGDPLLDEWVEPQDGAPGHYPLTADSPALDAADSELCPPSDQIGTERPQGAGCDIGAYESAADADDADE